MMISMFSAVSGLKSHQTRMDVIGNNIANVNTTAFKSSRTTFQDAYSQLLSAATAPGATTGGTNPKQVGLGMSIASIDMMTSRGAMQPTDRPLDLYINGDGYFLVETESGLRMTRAGNLSLDTEGNLVNSNGYRVLGWDRALMLVDPTGAGNVVAPVNILVPPESITDYSGIAIDKYGLITALDATGARVDLGRVAIAGVPNPEALTQEGNNLYSASGNSGVLNFVLAAGQYTFTTGGTNIYVGSPGSGTVGTLVSGVLEMSNVDLSREFTDMIITQRGFQANSRIITTADEMLQDLVNLKR
jgi:flagellar hook protein FlgE